MSMVFCRGCGKEIHETAAACPLCGAAQSTLEVSEKGKASYIKYDQVPWYRKTWFLVVFFIIFPPVLLLPLLTGSIYYSWDGQLKAHSKFVRGFLIFWAVMGIYVYPSIFREGKTTIEKSACPLVTQIIHEQLKASVDCKVVKITQDLGNGLYKADATLSNGSDLKITIEKKDKNIEVTIPPGQ